MNLLQAYSFLNKITEEADDTLNKYKQYVLTHKSRVKAFYWWLQKAVPEVLAEVNKSELQELIEYHDDSKFGEEEFEPYARFWGNESDDYAWDPEYEAAWEHHWMTNEHHPEHWDGKDMPLIYILEMLCDWGSFSIASHNMRELIDYYYEEARDDTEKNLSENTKKKIEEILSKIEDYLDKEEE